MSNAEQPAPTAPLPDDLAALLITQTAPTTQAPHSPEEEARLRAQLTKDFAEGRLVIENGWLVELNEPCPSPCAGPGYGCPPGCNTAPVIDIYSALESARLAQTFHPFQSL